MLKIGLQIAALVLFIIAAIPFEPSAPYTLKLIAAGLACQAGSAFA